MTCCRPGCEKRIDPGTAWPEVRGFARPHTQRGENSVSSLVGREATGQFMCQSCATSLIHGVAQGQGTLG